MRSLVTTSIPTNLLVPWRDPPKEGSRDEASRTCSKFCRSIGKSIGRSMGTSIGTSMGTSVARSTRSAGNSIRSIGGSGKIGSCSMPVSCRWRRGGGVRSAARGSNSSAGEGWVLKWRRIRFLSAGWAILQLGRLNSPVAGPPCSGSDALSRLASVTRKVSPYWSLRAAKSASEIMMTPSISRPPRRPRRRLGGSGGNSKGSRINSMLSGIGLGSATAGWSTAISSALPSGVDEASRRLFGWKSQATYPPRFGSVILKTISVSWQFNQEKLLPRLGNPSWNTNWSFSTVDLTTFHTF